MAKLLATRTAQEVLSAEFVFNFNDTMVDTTGVLYNFSGAATAGGVTQLPSVATGTRIFEVIKLPPNAVVVGGTYQTITAFDTAGYDISIGDAGSATRYVGVTDLKGAAANPVALTLTGFATTDTSKNVRMAVGTDDECTTGKFKIRVEYIIVDRATTTVPN